VVVDYDAKTIASGTTAQHGAPSYGKLDHEATKPLADADRDRLARRGTTRGSSHHRARPHLRSPIADYDKLLIVADGDDTFYLEGFGPIRRSVAADVLRDLRGIAGS
jgi:hypothetical protein